MQVSLLVLVTGGQIALAVDRWVHKRQIAEKTIADAADGAPSVSTRLAEHRREQEQNNARVEEELKRLNNHVDRINEEASRRHTFITIKVGESDNRLVRLETKLEEVFRLLGRRLEGGRKHLDESN